MVDPYRQLLDMEPGLGLDAAYLWLREQEDTAGPDTSRLRQAWRVLRDPWYRSVYERFGTSALEPAGFFDDESEPARPHMSAAPSGTVDADTDQKPDQYQLLQVSDPMLLTTPFDKLLNNITQMQAGGRPRGEARGKPAVLLTTGGFAPLHNGHLRMMQAARAAVEAGGQTVIGGYISPGHDQYVRSKDSAVAGIDERLLFCQQICRQSRWLYADPWEGRYTDRAVNFTDVIAHLQAYLARHLPLDVDVWYVFGADNAGFARAFIEHGQCVCVSRRQMSIDPRLQEDMAAVADRVLFTAYDGEELWASSAKIRSGNDTHLPQRDLADEALDEHQPRTYALRDDLAWACADWGLDKGILRDFTTSLSEYVNASLGDKISEVTLFHPETQEEIIADLRTAMINCDPVTRPGHHLQVCRQFEIADGQIHADRLRERPGSPSLDDQLRQLPGGQYLLVDDDIASGYTMQTLRRLMPARVEIIGQLSLLQKTIAEPVFDVCDCKDFLLGAAGGGLVVSLPDGSDARIPYMLPYTSLATRAKLPVSGELAHSLSLWQLNLDFHQQSSLGVADAAPECRALLSYLGFTADQSLADVCRWHLQMLEQIKLTDDDA